MRPRSFFDFCSQFNHAINRRVLAFTTLYTPDVFCFILCLHNNRIIYGYSIDVRLSRIYIYLIYFLMQPLTRRLLLYSKRKVVKTLSLIELKKFQHGRRSTLQPLLIIQNQFGFLTHLQAIKLRCSGHFCCFIYFS